MMGKIKTHHISEPYFDIGTLNSLKQARNFLRKVYKISLIKLKINKNYYVFINNSTKK